MSDQMTVSKHQVTRFDISGLGATYGGNMTEVYRTEDGQFAVVQGKSGKFYPVVYLYNDMPSLFWKSSDESKSYKTLNGAVKFVNDWDEDFK